MKFEPEHFPELGDQAYYAARVANEMFQKWLAKQPVVYGQAHDVVIFQQSPYGVATHKARLVCIEPIAKCEHKNVYQKQPVYLSFYCNDCGARLKAVNWEEI